MSVTNLNFADASAVKAVAPNLWTSELREGWGLGGIPNGGYQLAIAGRVAAEASGFPDPLSLHATYTKKASEAPVEIEVEVFRKGRTTSGLHVSMRQEGALVTQVTALMGSLDDATDQILWNNPRPEMIDRSHYVALENKAGEILPPPIVNRMGVWAHPEDVGFAAGKPSGNPLMRGWTKFRDGTWLDVFGVLVGTDIFAPPIFNSGGNVGWVPTLTLTVQVRKRPTSQWLYGEFSTDSLNGQYLTEEGELWDEEGELVAVSRQLAMLPR